MIGEDVLTRITRRQKESVAEKTVSKETPDTEIRTSAPAEDNGSPWEEDF